MKTQTAHVEFLLFIHLFPNIWNVLWFVLFVDSVHPN